MITPRCPVCNTLAEQVDGTKIYGERASDSYRDRLFYRCPVHLDYYVGCHLESGSAFGVLANKQHRMLKMKCPELFDHFWLRKKKFNRREARQSAYRKLERAMDLEIDDTHFGMFSEEQCKKAIDILARWYL